MALSYTLFAIIEASLCLVASRLIYLENRLEIKDTFQKNYSTFYLIEDGVNGMVPTALIRLQKSPK